MSATATLAERVDALMDVYKTKSGGAQGWSGADRILVCIGPDAPAKFARPGPLTPGCGVHEDRPLLLEAHLPRQRDIRGEEREDEAGALGERRAVRERYERSARHGGELGVRAPGNHRHHPGPVLELSRELHAEHGRQLRHLRIAAAPDQDVEEVDPGRAHAHESLAVLRDGVVDVTELERRVDRRQDGGLQLVGAVSAANCSRSAILRNLPTLVFGISATNSIRSGTHHFAKLGTRNSRSSSAVAAEPSRSTTAASGAPDSPKHTRLLPKRTT